ncbi:MAG: type II toxin-antitoxin system VapC family toxin [Longimicrobiales bacterium]|nr:type II toxin-antitoxin system VapC family toxin [Longimicrobiales bacterium]
MLRFMLDTDTCSYLMKAVSGALDQRLAEAGVEDVCISVLTKAELLFGVAVSPRPSRDRESLDQLLAYMQVLDLPEAAADHYAEIRADLQRKGKLIGANDLLLGAHARCLGLTLVTNNVREFSRVPGLKVENWVESEP